MKLTTAYFAQCQWWKKVLKLWHLQPAVVESAIVFVFKAHAEQHDDESPTPSNAGILYKMITELSVQNIILKVLQTL